MLTWKNTGGNERGKENIDHILVTSKRSAGMTEYHEAIHSDHRAFVIDIDFEKLTGGETHELREQEERVVKSNNPKIQRKYRQEMTKQFKQQNYQERLTKILQKEEISEEDIREAEKLTMKQQTPQ